MLSSINSVNIINSRENKSTAQSFAAKAHFICKNPEKYKFQNGRNFTDQCRDFCTWLRMKKLEVNGRQIKNEKTAEYAIETIGQVPSKEFKKLAKKFAWENWVKLRFVKSN